MSQSTRNRLDEIRKKRLQLFSSSDNQNTKPQGPPDYHTIPAPADPPFSGMDPAFENTAFHSYHTPPPGLPPYSYTPYTSTASNSTAGYVLPNPYAQDATPNSLPYGTPGTTSSMFGAASHMATPSPSSREDEEIARQLQDMYDAEELSHDSNPPMWSESPFKSDEEYALSLAQGFDQHSGSPISIPRAVPSTLPTIEMDEEYARQLQKELDSCGGRRSEEHDYSTTQPEFDSPDEQPPVEIDVQTDLVPLHKFGQQILQSECANCKKHLLNSEKDITKLTKTWLDKQGRVDSVLQCPKCSKHTCIGCGKLHKSYKPSSSLQPKATNVREIDITMCCQEGRLFLIWALLCAADHQKSCNDRRDAVFSKSQTPRRTSSDPTKGRATVRMSNGTGYGGQDGYGHGAYYGMDGEEFEEQLIFMSKGRRDTLPPKPVAISKENTEEVLLTQVFTALTKLLPALVETGHPFDFEPPEILPIMLKRSPVLEKAADLLRNDSLDDITHRHKLYEALLSFVERLANHPATAQTIFSQRVIYPADTGLLSASFNDNRYELRSSDKGKFKAETSRALSEIAMQLEVSARKMLQRSKAAEDDFRTPEGQNMLKLCGEICKLAGFLEENFFIDRKANNELSYKGKGKEPVRSQENMSQWHREHCVDEVPDSAFEKTFYFWREATTNQGIPPKGRMKSLMTDLATLQTSLPEGIYVRHGASRLDMMKVLIVGPKSTPYEGGLFEFDLFCPLAYPATPPKMQFRTTGGGAAHFNPNLYADGKVCLSLLGTWSGQPWVASGPNKSTLLQLCISIQSMILCDEPWYNEPGRESQPNPAASADYNKLIQSLTLPHALTNWLDLNNVNNPIWKDIIEKHFRFNGQSILESVRTWSKSADEHTKKPLAGHPNPFNDGYHTGLGKVATRIPSLARDFEKALQTTFGVVNIGNGIVLGSALSGEGKRKFGVP